jgi:uncharacterized protein involved in exopolysaccharide biosynthesis
MAQTITSLETQLAAVQSAIEAILVRGQEYRIGDIAYTAANLTALQQQESILLRRISRLSASGRSDRTMGVF